MGYEAKCKKCGEPLAWEDTHCPKCDWFVFDELIEEELESNEKE